MLKLDNTLYVADTNNNAIRIIDLDKKTVSTLAITEPRTEVLPEFSTQLPNAEKTDAQTITASVPVAIAIALKSGWHINPDAPELSGALR